jgi:hypothetical protein
MPTAGSCMGDFRTPNSARNPEPSSPFPGTVSRPESGHSFRLPVCCLTEIDGRPRIKVASSRISPNLIRNGSVALARRWGDRRRKSLRISHVGLQRSPVSVSHSVGPPGRRPPTGRHNFRMLISRAGRRCSSRYSRYGVSTSSIHFMNARTRRDRLLRCATTRDTASARRRESGMISTSAPLSKYRPIPKSGA